MKAWSFLLTKKKNKVTDEESKWNREKYSLQEQVFLVLVLFQTAWGQGRKITIFLKASYSADTHWCSLVNAGRATLELIEVEKLTYTTNFDWQAGLILNKTWKCW